MPIRSSDPAPHRPRAWLTSALLLVAFLTACGGGALPLTVSSYGPTDGQTGVPIDAVVTATFDRAIDPDSLDGAFTLVPDGGTAVAGTVDLSDDGRTATFTPDDPLTHATEYTATLTGNVTTTDGARLQGQVTWTFTTATAPADPTVTRLGTGFAVAPAGVTFDAAYAVEPPASGGATTCTLTLDGAPLATVDPCTTGTVPLGPFAAGATPELRLVARTAEGGEATETWSFTTAAWAPFQRLEGDAPIVALAGSGARLAVLRTVPTDAVEVLERASVVATPSTWAPAPVDGATTVAGVGDLAAMAWNGDDLALMTHPIDDVVEVTRHREVAGVWTMPQATGVAWSDAFGAARLAVSDELTVIGDATVGDAGRWVAATPTGVIDQADAWPDAYPAAVAGDLAGAAVAALGDVVAVGHPGAAPSGVPPVPNGRVLLVATEEPAAVGLGGGFGSGPGSAVGRHLAVLDATSGVLFQAGARGIEWGRLAVSVPDDAEPGDPGERVLEVLGTLELADATWIAVTPPPSFGGPTLLAALLAVGLPDGTVALYYVPLAGSQEAISIGTVDAAGSTGPGAWVGQALALPFAADIVLYDAPPPPPPSDDGPDA
jgi:hypothetical protein